MEIRDFAESVKGIFVDLLLTAVIGSARYSMVTDGVNISLAVSLPFPYCDARESWGGLCKKG